MSHAPAALGDDVGARPVAAQEPDCISAAFGDIPGEGHRHPSQGTLKLHSRKLDPPRSTTSFKPTAGGAFSA
jgi:hypothetical protein